MKNTSFFLFFNSFYWKWVICPPIGMLFTKFGNLTIYYIWNIQAFKFSSVLYLKGFGTFQLEFETVELYYFKV